MKLRNIQRFEIVIGRFNLRTFDHRKSDGNKNVFDFLKDLANQMARANGAHHSRQREIDLFFCGDGLFRAGFDRRASRFDLRVHERSQFIQASPNRALQIRRRRLQPVVGNSRKHAGFAAEPPIAKLFERRLIVYRGRLRIETRANFREQSSELRRIGDAESGERFFVRTFGGRHDGRIDYNATLHKESCTSKNYLAVAIEERFLDAALAKFATAPLGMTNRAERSELDYFFFAAAFGAKAFAFSASAVKPAASFTAMSASTLRSSSTPAAFSPWIN